jgi:hypothetical protein
MSSKAETQKGKAETKMSNKAETIEDFFGPVISMYTRQDALADGVLVDVSEMAKEAGFSIPVAVTTSVWHDCIDWPEDEANGYGQSIDGRQWDVLKMAYFKIRSTRDQSEDLLYQLSIIPRGTKPENTGAIDDFTGAEDTTLKINIGPGDNAEPVLTIMLPNED